jgi:DnaJ-domain-containing protein 1
MAFHGLCSGNADQSRALLEAWLDRNRPEWRAAWGGGAGAASSAPGRMSKEEAYAVLGLKTGASADDIRAAHRRLMKDFHPDKGGTDYLAAKINAAKDVLLGG